MKEQNQIIIEDLEQQRKEKEYLEQKLKEQHKEITMANKIIERQQNVIDQVELSQVSPLRASQMSSGEIKEIIERVEAQVTPMLRDLKSSREFIMSRVQDNYEMRNSRAQESLSEELKNKLELAMSGMMKWTK